MNSKSTTLLHVLCWFRPGLGNLPINHCLPAHCIEIAGHREELTGFLDKTVNKFWSGRLVLLWISNGGEMGMHFVSLRLQLLTRVVYLARAWRVSRADRLLTNHHCRLLRKLTSTELLFDFTPSQRIFYFHPPALLDI